MACMSPKLSPEQEAAESGAAEPKVTELDVWALVVRAGIKNTPDDYTGHLKLAAYAKNHCGPAMVSYLFKNRAKLPGLIDDIWSWEEVDSIVGIACQSRMQLLTAALRSACTCGGAWTSLVEASLQANGIDVGGLCTDILNAMDVGRGELTPVVVLAGRQGGEGKSLLLKPLFSVFPLPGQVFPSPRHDKFPLQGIESSKVVFLDEFRFDGVLPYMLQCLLFDGSAVPVARPQNVPGAAGHFLYKGTSPVFITTKLDSLEALEAAARPNPETGLPFSVDASMIWGRLKIYRFEHRVPRPDKKFNFCAHCFASFLRKHYTS